MYTSLHVLLLSKNVIYAYSRTTAKFNMAETESMVRKMRLNFLSQIVATMMVLYLFFP